jgi:hypothetical protein
MYDKRGCLIGAEVKPELSWNQFQHALGQVIVQLTNPFWMSRVDEGMIIMPFNSSGDSKTIRRMTKLMDQFTYVLKNCSRRGYAKVLSSGPVEEKYGGGTHQGAILVCRYTPPGNFQGQSPY